MAEQMEMPEPFNPEQTLKKILLIGFIPFIAHILNTSDAVYAICVVTTSTHLVCEPYYIFISNKTKVLCALIGQGCVSYIVAMNNYQLFYSMPDGSVVTIIVGRVALYVFQIDQRRLLDLAWNVQLQ